MVYNVDNDLSEMWKERRNEGADERTNERTPRLLRSYKAASINLIANSHQQLDAFTKKKHHVTTTKNETTTTTTTTTRQTHQQQRRGKHVLR